MSEERAHLPAILGGTPVRPDGPPPWPLPDADVRDALAAVASGAWGQYHGEHVVALEADLAAFHGVPHALTCATGTLAVEAALRALRVGPGDEVVMAAYDYESNFLTVHAVGAKPVLVDVAPGNWNLDPARLEAAFTPQTKAVICSHLHGGLVPMREVVEVARKHGVGVVEDTAQAPGATVQGRAAGTWGDVGTLSFGGSKLLTAGRGGALLFRDATDVGPAVPAGSERPAQPALQAGQLYQRAKVWLHRGLQQWAPLSEMQAAALRPQLAKLRDETTRRAENIANMLASRERERPEGHAPVAHAPGSPGGSSGAGLAPGLIAFENCTEQSIPAFYKVGFRYDAAAFGLSRDLFVKAMRAEGIAFDAGFNALHVGRSPSRFRAVGNLPNATAAHHGCVVLHHPVLSGSLGDVQQVADAVAKVYRHRERIAEWAGR